MRDLLIKQSCNHQSHDLTLTRRQQIETLTKFADFRTLGTRFAIVFQRLPDRVHQLVFSYGLR
jgi:hypothetical protein